MSRVISKPAAELAVGDYVRVAAPPLGATGLGTEGPVTQIEDNPARGSTGAYRRVYFRDVSTDRVRSFSAYPAESVVVMEDE